MAADEETAIVQVESNLDAFAELQAILAGLPMHAVPPPVFSRTCGMPMSACGGDRRPPPQVDDKACIHRVRLALRQARLDYPDRAAELRRLVVEHASLDLVCFADHKEARLFTAVRGTDRGLNPLTTPRDWNNDVLILFGLPPCRTSKALNEYRSVKSRFPLYKSFASGHSLGATIVEHLALYVEEDAPYRFSRVDVFNTGSSPLKRTPSMLTVTELHAHRVPGDWASEYYQPPGGANLHTYKPKHHVESRHRLGHFLPEKAVASSAETTGGEDGEHEDDDDDDDEGKVPQAGPPPPPHAFDLSLLLSLFTCVGVRKGKSLHSERRDNGRLALQDSGSMEESEDQWRNCEAPDAQPSGPSEELQELPPQSQRQRRASSSHSLPRPYARSQDEDECDELIPQSFAAPSLRLRLAQALDTSLYSGELREAVANVASVQAESVCLLLDSAVDDEKDTS